MIDKYKSIKSIGDKTIEGKLLIMALAALTSLSLDDIKDKRWGGSVSPDDALERIVDIANQVYYEDEWKSEQKMKKRDKKINIILNE